MASFLAQNPSVTKRGTGRLVERELLTPTLGIFRFALEGGVPDFEAGQYLTLGLAPEPSSGPAPGSSSEPVPGSSSKPAPGEQITWRPYSVASPPEETRHVDFLVRWAVHPVEGVFTTRLGRLKEGDTIHWRGPRGHFTIRERTPDGRPDRRRLLLVAAGTGVAPFTSYLGHLEATEDEREVVLLHGASYVDELAYRERFEDLARQGKLVYLPTISRPDESHNDGWSGGTGRVERWLEEREGEETCALERELAIRLDPEHTSAHLCGSEGMVHAARAALEARGFRDARHPHADGRHDLVWEAYG
jgi:ferredoxin--NADP+ reductase